MQNLGKTWAQALMKALNNQEDQQACLQFFQNLSNLMTKFPNFKQILLNPAITMNVKLSILQEFAPPNKTIQNAINLLIERKKLHLIESIAEHLAKIIQGESRRTLICTHTKSSSEVDLKGLETQVDESLIAGFKLITENHIIDASLSGRMRKLQKTLQA